MSNVYAVSAAPHLKQKISVSGVMWQVVGALTPALIAAAIFFGWQAILLVGYGVAAAVLTEALIQRWRGIPVTIKDGSAVVTGILVSFNINSAAPWWIPVIGSVFAIAIGSSYSAV